ncbi:ATP-binding protein [Eubacteriales bacterium OttesenSCG-928-N13]|nr:ATP-binding protein [Eubacteriales bacterium OttesenSCG-928-N13]
MMHKIDAELRHEYARQREQNEREREQRYQQAIARDPSIKALQDGLQTRLFSDSRALLNPASDSQKMMDTLRQDVARVHREIAQKLNAIGMNADDLTVKHRCEACKDTGYVGELGERMCDCYRVRRLNMMREQAGLSCGDGQRFETFDVDVFSDAKQRDEALFAKSLCQNYVDQIQTGSKLNLVLMGESGLGKTFLLNCVADRAIAQGIPAMPISAFHMLSAMREYHFGQNGGDSLLNQLIECELLLIDDLGTEPMLRNITVEYLFMLLNERINHRRHTVVATNLSPNELMERYNERVVSRLMDRTAGELIRLSGKDLRFRT